MSSVTVIVDIQDVDANYAIEAIQEIRHILVDLVNQSNRVTVTLVERIEHMQMEFVNAKNMLLERDVINVLFHHST